ncbi:MAG: hypothetical protein WCR66_14365 [Bacteroidota bacterium]
MERNEQQVFEYLLNKSGLNSQDGEGSFFSKLLLLADPDGKLLDQASFNKINPMTIPNTAGEQLYYIPLKYLSLSRRLKHAITELESRYNDAHILASKIRYGGAIKLNQTDADGKPVSVNITVTKSVLSEAKHELKSMAVIINDIYGLLSSKAGTTNYSLQQIILSNANQGFMQSLVGPSGSLRSILSNVIFQNVDYLIKKETEFLNFSEIGQYEGVAAMAKAQKANYQKKGRKNTYTVFPVAYEKVADLVASLIKKWLRTSKPSSDSSQIEENNRLKKVGGKRAADLVPFVYQQLGINPDVSVSDLPEKVIEVALPVDWTPTNGKNTPFPIGTLVSIYEHLGGDSRVLPPVVSIVSGNQFNSKTLSNALDTISKASAFNERFMFAAFKLLGLDATVGSNFFTSRKPLPLEIELALLNVNGIDLINKASSDTPSLIISDEAFRQITPGTDLYEHFVSRHAEKSQSGYVQKGSMSISSLIRGGAKKVDVSYGTNIFSQAVDINKAIDLLSFASDLYKFQSIQQVDALKKERDTFLKEEKKAEKNGLPSPARQSVNTFAAPAQSFAAPMQPTFAAPMQPTFAAPSSFSPPGSRAASPNVLSPSRPVFGSEQSGVDTDFDNFDGL